MCAQTSRKLRVVTNSESGSGLAAQLSSAPPLESQQQTRTVHKRVVLPNQPVRSIYLSLFVSPLSV